MHPFVPLNRDRKEMVDLKRFFRDLAIGVLASMIAN